MKNNNKGITMVSLIITIVVMFIIAGATVYTSLDRFKVNELSKMYNDIKLLSDKVSNYYLKYNGLPVVRDSSNNPVVYPVSSLNFDKNINDSGDYYIIDLKTMDGITLNYGEEGSNNPTASAKDIYIINGTSHVIYYVKGIEAEGTVYHTLPNDENTITDNIPPAKPEIRVVSGTKNKSGIYISEVEVEIIPGKDSWSGINKTTYSINNGTEKDITTLTNNILKISEEGAYEIKAKSYDQSGNVSGENSSQLTISILRIGDKVAYDEGYSSTKTNTVDSSFKMNDMEWRILDIEENGRVKLISTQPTKSTLTLSGQQDWLDVETKLDTLCRELYTNGTGVIARSLKVVEDVDKIAGIKTDEDRKAVASLYGIKYKYKYDTVSGNIQYSEQKSDGTWTAYEDAGYRTYKDPRGEEISSSHYQDATGRLIEEEIEVDGISYIVSSQIDATLKTSDGILISDLITKGLNDANNAANSTYIAQWSSERQVVKMYKANKGHMMSFHVRSVFDNYRGGHNLFYSNGDVFTWSLSVRPIILLQSEVLTEKVNGVWQVQL